MSVEANPAPSKIIPNTFQTPNALTDEVMRLLSGNEVKCYLVIVRKTFGLAAPLREALLPIADAITAAFVFGSVAKGQDTASSDIDLMLISESLTYGEVMAALHPVAEQLDRTINPTLYSPAELKQRIATGNSFVTRVLAQPRIWLLGGEHELAA